MENKLDLRLDINWNAIKFELRNVNLDYFVPVVFKRNFQNKYLLNQLSCSKTFIFKIACRSSFSEVCILEQRSFKMVCLLGTPDYYCLKSTKKKLASMN